MRTALLNRQQLTYLSYPTGYGKTFASITTMADVCDVLRLRGEKCVCAALMPFRVSIKEMYKFVNSKIANKKKVGYSMRDDVVGSKNDHVTMYTVGYWLESFLPTIKNLDEKTRYIVMIDEAHDHSWTTDLAIKVLFWLQRSRPIQLQIIVSSATFDDSSLTSLTSIKPLVFACEEACNTDIHFLKDEEDRIIDITKDIMTSSTRGDILVILPGQDDIDNLMDDLSHDKTFDQCEIHALHSQLAREDIEAAIVPDANGKRKIICATNIVENAITIRNLDFLIDSGMRKVIHIDTDGTQHLALEKASKSNIKQATGRVGREGRRGTAYVMMSEMQYTCLAPYSASEALRNPLYQQIIKLVSLKLPLEILGDERRVERDVEFLLDNDILVRNQGCIEVTDIGRIVARLPLSIKAGRLVACSQTYLSVVVAAWVDLQLGLFYRPSKKPRESKESYDTAMEVLRDRQSIFHGKDCLTSALRVWSLCHDEVRGYRNFESWCRDNGIFSKALKEMRVTVRHALETLQKLGIEVEVDNKNLDDRASEIKDQLKLIFMKNVFQRGFRGDYARQNAMTLVNTTYVIDRFVLERSQETLSTLIATKLRRISPFKILISNTIKLSDE